MPLTTHYRITFNPPDPFATRHDGEFHKYPQLTKFVLLNCKHERMHGGGEGHGWTFGQHHAQRGGAVRSEVVRQGGGETSGFALRALPDRRAVLVVGWFRSAGSVGAGNSITVSQSRTTCAWPVKAHRGRLHSGTPDRRRPS
jgi:hypothetical protein